MEDIFKKYYSRLVRIAILKSICFSVIIGFGVNFLVALVMLFFDLSVGIALGFSIGAGVLAMVCAAPLLYRFKFKPTVNKMASALDGQGLEERTVTMIEFKNDDSFVARAQRENAVKKLESVNPKSLRFVLPTIAVVLISASIILGVSMTTVTALSAADIIQLPHKDSAQEAPEESDKPDEEEDTVSVLYEAGEHGRVDGELFQEFEKGGSAKPVVAVPEEGYVFSFWSDGVFTAERQDRNVASSFSVTAIFTKEVVVGPGEEGDGQGGGNAGSGQQGGGQQGGGAGDGQDGDGGGDGEGQDGEGEGGGGASGSTAKDNNTVIDGNTDYRNEINYQAAREEILKDETLAQEEKDMLLKYLDTLMEDSENNQ